MGADTTYTPSITLGAAGAASGTNSLTQVDVVSGSANFANGASLPNGGSMTVGDPALFGESMPVITPPSTAQLNGARTNTAKGTGTTTANGTQSVPDTLTDIGPPPLSPAVLAAQAAANAAAERTGWLCARG